MPTRCIAQTRHGAGGSVVIAGWGRRRVATHPLGRVRVVGDGLASCECFGCGTEVSLMERGWRDVGTAEVHGEAGARIRSGVVGIAHAGLFD